MSPDLTLAEAASMASVVEASQALYHGKVAKDQARAHYGNVYGNVYYGNGVQTKRDIAQEILASLRFPGMDRYHERPLDSFPGTYEWIFDGTSTNFKQWLTGSDEVYWVNGKAGSGKSCLMKLVSEHPRTIELLQEWAGGEVTVVPFFFWAAGGELERSQLGLMRSLLFQILDQHSNLIQTCLSQRWTAHERRANYEKPWSHGELQRALTIALRQERMTSRFCFLIDGLDEFDGDHQDLIDYLDTLNTSECAKLLVSSRPWNVFYAAYGHSNQVWRLRLQDLTAHDMDLFIKSRFENDSRFQALITKERSRRHRDYGLRNLEDQLRTMAEGMFLWVALAMKTLRRGLVEYDTLAGLSKRLGLLPKEMDGMLQHIFDSIEPVYHQLAARTFLILDSLESQTEIRGTWKGLPVTWIAYLEQEGKAKSSDIPGFNAYELEQNEQRRRHVEQMVRRCCRDLVEIHCKRGDTKELVKKSVFPRKFVGRTYIRYGHRTMFDFIRSKVQDGCLQSLAGCSFDPKLSTCRLMVLVSAPSLPEYYAHIVWEFMYTSRELYSYSESEAELSSSVEQLIKIGVTLESDGKPWCEEMKDIFADHNHIREVALDLDDDLELRVATLMGCTALVWGQERLFWSWITAKPCYVHTKSRRVWTICSLWDQESASELPGTIIKLSSLSNVSHQQMPSLIDSSPAAESRPTLHDICEIFRNVVDERYSQYKFRHFLYVAIWLASCGAELGEYLEDEELCEDILSWSDNHVNVEELALSCPSPSHTVDLYWGGHFSTKLMYDEHEFLRQFWPSVESVMDHCRSVIAEAKISRNGA